MDEARLIEITTTICKLGGHLWPVIYLSQMKEEEKNIFLKYVDEYVKKSKYPDIELCYAIVAFSYEYLRSKNITLTDISNKNKTLEEEEKEVISYLDGLFMSEQNVELTTQKHRK